MDVALAGRGGGREPGPEDLLEAEAVEEAVDEGEFSEPVGGEFEGASAEGGCRAGGRGEGHGTESSLGHGGLWEGRE